MADALTGRRGEEDVRWAAIAHHGTEAAGARGVGGINALTATYLNRLSDLLFILARYANREQGDVLWVPGGERGDQRQKGDA